MGGEWWRRRQRDGAATVEQMLVGVEQLTQDDREPTTVHQGVVNRPDEDTPARTVDEEREAHARRRRHVDPPVAVGRQPSAQLGRSLRFRRVVARDDVDVRGHRVVNLLTRLVAGERERCAQYVVTALDVRPGALHHGGIDPLVVEVADDLQDVHPGMVRQVAVEQHPELHRRDRVDGRRLVAVPVRGSGPVDALATAASRSGDDDRVVRDLLRTRDEYARWRAPCVGMWATGSTSSGRSTSAAMVRRRKPRPPPATTGRRT